MANHLMNWMQYPLPAHTRALEIRNQSAYAMRFSFTTGKVATPTAPYSTIDAGTVFYKDNLDLSSVTLYVASTHAADVVEIRSWT